MLASKILSSLESEKIVLSYIKIVYFRNFLEVFMNLQPLLRSAMNFSTAFQQILCNVVFPKTEDKV